MGKGGKTILRAKSGSSEDLRVRVQQGSRWGRGGGWAAASGCLWYSVGPAARQPDETHVWPPGEGSFPKPDVHQLRCHLFFFFFLRPFEMSSHSSPPSWPSLREDEAASPWCFSIRRNLYRLDEIPRGHWWTRYTVNYVSTCRCCLKTCCYLLLAPGSVCSCPPGRSLLKKTAPDWLISDETFRFQRSEMMLETPILALSCAEQELKEESVNWC